MNPKYFKEQIEEEMYGAKCYIKKAMHVRASHPAWASTFESMSKMELGHATNLYKMLMSDEFENCPDNYVASTKECTTHIYTECSDELEKLYDVYDLLKANNSVVSG